MGRYDDSNFDIGGAYHQYSKQTNNNTMVIHPNSTLANGDNGALDMPRRFNEY